MNTKHLKSYAPKARVDFMAAVEKRLAWLGIYANKTADVQANGATSLIEGRIFERAVVQQRQRLIERIAKLGFKPFVEQMAYTWFNRLASLRYMELHDYLEHGYRVLSARDAEGTLPEILAHAADVADTLGLNKQQIIEMQLAGDQQEALYRTLLIGQCHYLHQIMPFLFEPVDDETELLLPDNLTRTDSLLHDLVKAIPEDDWQQVEVIGWLYQFYISEKKDQVIGSVVKSEDIPAATQLFTPNWIVKYLVQNSLGRQWLQTYPDSAIKAKMEYFIGPGEQPAEVMTQLAQHTPSSIEPESIKVLDPACGSGHILVEVYELLREIYLDRGYRLRDIPLLILSKNIYGLDIDDRAAQLAAFALMMKAREDDRRIFERVKSEQLQLNVFALQSTQGLQLPKLWQALNLDDKAQRGSSGDLFAALDTPAPELNQPSQPSLYQHFFALLQYVTTAFAQAKTLGSLVHIEHHKLDELHNLLALLKDKQHGSDPAAKQAAELLIPLIQQATVLAQQYDSVIANPPYMGSKGMNADLKDFAKERYPDSKSDLFAIFIERGFELNKDFGFNAMVTMQSWMFLSSYEALRLKILQQSSIECMAHMGNGVMGIAFGTAATVCKKGGSPLTLGAYCYVENDDIGENDKPKQFPPLNERNLNAAKQSKQHA